MAERVAGPLTSVYRACRKMGQIQERMRGGGLLSQALSSVLYVLGAGRVCVCVCACVFRGEWGEPPRRHHLQAHAASASLSKTHFDVNRLKQSVISSTLNKISKCNYI